MQIYPSRMYMPVACSLSLSRSPLPLFQVGSWGGNLMLTHDHDNFPSDVFTIMAAVGATLTLGGRS